MFLSISKIFHHFDREEKFIIYLENERVLQMSLAPTTSFKNFFKITSPHTLQNNHRKALLDFSPPCLE